MKESTGWGTVTRKWSTEVVERSGMRNVAYRGLPILPRRPCPSIGTDCVTPAFWEVAAIAALLLFYIQADFFFGEDSYEIVNWIGPIWLAIALGFGAVRAALLDPAAMWTGLLWFRIATAVYFGIGSIIHNFMNDYTMMQIRQYFFAEKEIIAKFNLITAASVLCVLGTAAVLGRLFPGGRPTASVAGGRLLLISGLIFATLGYAVKYLITVPAALGVYGDIVVPGLVAMFELCVPPGLFLLTLWILRFVPSWLPLMVIILAIDMCFGFLRFVKLDVLMPLIMFILALLHHKTSLVRLALAALTVLVTYQLIEPTTGYGRGVLGERYGTLRAASFTERLEIMLNYIFALEVLAPVDA